MVKLLPTAKAVGEAQKATIGGDEARVQDYTLEAQGKKMQIQAIVIRKKDIAVSVLGLGTEEGFKEFGRAVGITAQSITIKEEPPDPGLVGHLAAGEVFVERRRDEQRVQSLVQLFTDHLSQRHVHGALVVDVDPEQQHRPDGRLPGRRRPGVASSSGATR